MMSSHVSKREKKKILPGFAGTILLVSIVFDLDHAPSWIAGTYLGTYVHLKYFFTERAHASTILTTTLGYLGHHLATTWLHLLSLDHHKRDGKMKNYFSLLPLGYDTISLGYLLLPSATFGYHLTFTK